MRLETTQYSAYSATPILPLHARRQHTLPIENPSEGNATTRFTAAGFEPLLYVNTLYLWGSKKPTKWSVRGAGRRPDGARPAKSRSGAAGPAVPRARPAPARGAARAESRERARGVRLCTLGATAIAIALTPP